MNNYSRTVTGKQLRERIAYHKAGHCKGCGHILGKTTVLGYEGYEEVKLCTNQECEAFNISMP